MGTITLCPTQISASPQFSLPTKWKKKKKDKKSEKWKREKENYFKRQGS